ncbi:hypothetical protein HC891_01910 [Candidatus Gracilibacteria bacterium]|nr:hypothetical protein [Candidatus Gracilibacteria bacterium]
MPHERQCPLAFALLLVALLQRPRYRLVVAGGRIVGRVGDALAYLLVTQHTHQRVAMANAVVEEAKRLALALALDP